MKIKINKNKTREKEEEIDSGCLMQYWCSPQSGDYHRLMAWNKSGCIDLLLLRA